MPALTIHRAERIPMGDRFLFLVDYEGGTAFQNDTFLDPKTTGCKYVDGVIGIQKVGGTTAAAGGSSCVPNAEGTGITEGTNPGALGIEGAGAGRRHVAFVGR